MRIATPLVLLPHAVDLTLCDGLSYFLIGSHTLASAAVSQTSASAASTPPAIVALDAFQAPPYKVGVLTGQTVAGVGFTGTWAEPGGRLPRVSRIQA